MNNSDLITVGIVVKPQGIKGELKILPCSTKNTEKFLLFKEVYLNGNKHSVINCKITEGFVYMQISGVNTRNDAELLRQSNVDVLRSDEPPLEEGEYYIVDLIGSDVVVNNNKIGVLEYIDNYGATDIYTIKKSNGKSVMIPALKKTLLKIDTDNKVIYLDEKSYMETVVEN